jgi:ectoine hydroxylase-related dioxygenase (phytanoyl-CoA dioxygenase family)
MTATSLEQTQFDRDGYLIAADFCSEELSAISDQANALHNERQKLGFEDRNNGAVGLAFVTDVVAADEESPIRTLGRSDALTTAGEKFTGEVVELLYLTLSFKFRGAGEWNWHQDYRYWYEIGCLYPRMMTALLALDDMTTENGCLRVLEGSHQAGRVDHVQRGGQYAVDDTRLELLRKSCPERALECSAGSMIFMHANTIHASAGNATDRPRRALIFNLNGLSARPQLPSRFSPVPLISGRAIPQELRGDYRRHA